MPTKIVKCDGCKAHNFQDITYGEGMRVYIQGAGSEKKMHRCSVCRKEKTIGESESPKGKKR